MSRSRTVAARLTDILTAIGRIRQAEQQLVAADAREDVPATGIAFDAILYNLVVIGEAVNALPDDIVDGESQVPWRDVVGMRNFLAHEYFRVLADVVRSTIDAPLLALEAACHRLSADIYPRRP